MQYAQKRVCRWASCGREFIADHPSRIYCSPECRDKAKRASVRRYQASLYKKPKFGGYADRTRSTLSEAVVELEKYNRIHGTNYTYGQAVAKGII